MTTIKRRRRSCILEEFWRIIDGEMSISKRYLPFCWVQKQTGRLEALRRRKIIKATTEMTTIKRRRRSCILEEFWRIIHGEMSISKRNLPFCWDPKQTGRLEALRRRKIIKATTEMTTIERRRWWCNLEEFWIVIDGAMSISKSCLQYLPEQTKTGQFDTFMRPELCTYNYQHEHNWKRETMMYLDRILDNYWARYEWFKNLSVDYKVL